ncbi:restriction endonuclease subunit S [Rahnella variigena]|uniref:restriction endonuclease subunit S n=1 Tax=Rahnella variigena TaxID=574964 RepID=UPI0028DBCED4|nr:restriction endonuclease subunit S [Rahnella variigena]
MSELSYLEKLLDGAEVEWKALGDITNVLRGKRLTRNLLSAEEKFPVFHGGLEPLGYYNKSNRPANTVMIINVGASAGTVGYSTVDFWSSDGCFCLEHNELLNNRFLYFALIGYQSLLKSKVRVAGIPTLDAIVVSKLLIPIPCPDNPEKSLAIQSEIVRILDKFTFITAELTAELTMRKKQYNYYRDQLLSFEEDEVELKTLPEMAVDFGRGKSKHRPRNDEKLYGGDIPFIQTGDIRSASHTITQYSQTYSELGLKQSKLWPKGTLCITIAANIAETSILGFDACFPDSVIGFVPDPSKTSSGYVEYLLQSTKTKLEKKGKEKSSAQSNINLGTFEQLKLPFPSLAEQARIVAILDKFETMTNSIVEGLPREIGLRQKQYEYYRDLLLSFPKSNAQEVA